MDKLSSRNLQFDPKPQNLSPIFLGIACFAIVFGFNEPNHLNEEWLFGGGDAT